MPSPVAPTYVDTVEACQLAVKDMSRRDAVAVDLEGIEMKRDRICIIQLGAKDVIYIIDIIALGEEAFEQGGLRKFLENPTIKKLVYDCRYDSICLAKQHNTILANPRDLQISYVFKVDNARMRFLPGFRRALEEMEYENEEAFPSPKNERKAVTKLDFDRRSPWAKQMHSEAVARPSSFLKKRSFSTNALSAMGRR